MVDESRLPEILYTRASAETKKKIDQMLKEANPQTPEEYEELGRRVARVIVEEQGKIEGN